MGIDVVVFGLVLVGGSKSVLSSCLHCDRVFMRKQSGVLSKHMPADVRLVGLQAR